MAKKIIIANWKMNPKTPREAEIWVRNISVVARSIKNLRIVVAPSFVHIPNIYNLRLQTQNFQFCAQDVFWEDAGPYTGEVSLPQLKAYGVKHVLVGHSERRDLGETNKEINKKVKAVLENGMKAVLCVGERERKKETAFPVIIQEELAEGLKNIKKNFLKNLVIVYEPVWAISTTKIQNRIRFPGKDAPKNVFEMSVLIRRELYRLFGKKIAFAIPILYGGSVDDKNAADFVRLGSVDGLLVGGASLNAKKFSQIIKNVAKIK